MAAAKQSKTAVAEVPKTEGMMSMFNQDQTPDWAKGQGRGNENVGTKDLVLPRLEIVQAQSPIKDTNEDAREGMLFNSATGDLLGDTVFIVPIFFRVEYLVWKDNDKGGGFFGAYDSEGEAQARVQEEASNGEDPRDLEIVDTPVHYCLRVREDGSSEQIVISMPKSKAKVSRKWNAMIQIAGGDRFSRAYRVTTFKDKNKKNQTFHNFVVTPVGFPPESIFREAERLYAVFKTEGVKADHAAAGKSAGNGEGGGDDPEI